MSVPFQTSLLFTLLYLIRQFSTIERWDVFSLPNFSHEIVSGIGVQVSPPLVVLSKREEFWPCSLTAQPRVLETMSSKVTCLKLAPGASFIHSCARLPVLYWLMPSVPHRSCLSTTYLS